MKVTGEVPLEGAADTLEGAAPVISFPASSKLPAPKYLSADSSSTGKLKFNGSGTGDEMKATGEFPSEKATAAGISIPTSSKSSTPLASVSGHISETSEACMHPDVPQALLLSTLIEANTDEIAKLRNEIEQLKACMLRPDVPETSSKPSTLVASVDSDHISETSEARTLPYLPEYLSIDVKANADEIESAQLNAATDDVNELVMINEKILQQNCKDNMEIAKLRKEIEQRKADPPVEYDSSGKLLFNENEFLMINEENSQQNSEGGKPEKIHKEEAICRFCFKKFREDNVLKTKCNCEFTLIHEPCAFEWSKQKCNNRCDDCEQYIQNIPITLSNYHSSDTNKKKEKPKRIFGCFGSKGSSKEKLKRCFGCFGSQGSSTKRPWHISNLFH